MCTCCGKSGDVWLCTGGGGGGGGGTEVYWCKAGQWRGDGCMW